MSRWPVGDAEIERLLGTGELETTLANEEFARRLLDEATVHLASVAQILATDFSGAFQLGYDAARKACTAALAHQGLRPTQKGGHIAVSTAVRAQFNGKHGSQAFAMFDVLRKDRATSQYPQFESPSITADDAAYCLEQAQLIVADVERLIATGQLGVWH